MTLPQSQRAQIGGEPAVLDRKVGFTAISETEREAVADLVERAHSEAQAVGPPLLNLGAEERAARVGRVRDRRIGEDLLIEAGVGQPRADAEREAVGDLDGTADRAADNAEERGQPVPTAEGRGDPAVVVAGPTRDGEARAERDRVAAEALSDSEVAHGHIVVLDICGRIEAVVVLDAELVGDSTVQLEVETAQLRQPADEERQSRGERDRQPRAAMVTAAS